MKWYWIVLIVVGYIVVMTLTTKALKIYSKNDELTEPFCLLGGFFWPGTIVGFLLYKVLELVDRITD